MQMRGSKCLQPSSLPSPAHWLDFVSDFPLKHHMLRRDEGHLDKAFIVAPQVSVGELPDSLADSIQWFLPGMTCDSIGQDCPFEHLDVPRSETK